MNKPHLLPDSEPGSQVMRCAMEGVATTHDCWTFMRSGACGHKGHGALYLVIRRCINCGCFTEWMKVDQGTVEIVLTPQEVNRFLAELVKDELDEPDLPF